MPRRQDARHDPGSDQHEHDAQGCAQRHVDRAGEAFVVAHVEHPAAHRAPAGTPQVSARSASTGAGVGRDMVTSGQPIVGAMAHPGTIVEAVELHRVALPLVRPLRASHGLTATRDVLLVRVRTTDGEGWGECSAEAEPTYTAEYTDGAAHVLRTHLIPRLLEAGPVDRLDGGVARLLAVVRGHPMARAGSTPRCSTPSCALAAPRWPRTSAPPPPTSRPAWWSG